MINGVKNLILKLWQFLLMIAVRKNVLRPLLNGKKWPYTILLDTNQDLKRALGMANVPYTVVVKNNKIVYVHNGYSQGAEKELYNKLKQL